MVRKLLGIRRRAYLGTAVCLPTHSESHLLTELVELPAAHCVWASTPQASFLHGRFVWTDWGVDELLEMKERFEDPGFLKFGLQGVDPVSPAAFFAMT